MEENRRASQRKQACHDMLVTYKKPGFLSFIMPAKELEVVDFYKGGLGVISNLVFEKYVPFFIDLTYHTLSLSQIKAIITHKQPSEDGKFRYGLMFQNVTPEDQAILDEIDTLLQ